MLTRSIGSGNKLALGEEVQAVCITMNIYIIVMDSIEEYWKRKPTSFYTNQFEYKLQGKLMIPLGLDYSPCKFVDTRLAFLAIESVGLKNSGSFQFPL